MNYEFLGKYHFIVYIIRIIKKNNEHNLLNFFFLNVSISGFLKTSFL